MVRCGAGCGCGRGLYKTDACGRRELFVSIFVYLVACRLHCNAIRCKLHEPISNQKRVWYVKEILILKTIHIHIWQNNEQTVVLLYRVPLALNTLYYCRARCSLGFKNLFLCIIKARIRGLKLGEARGGGMVRWRQMRSKQRAQFNMHST